MPWNVIARGIAQKVMKSEIMQNLMDGESFGIDSVDSDQRHSFSPYGGLALDGGKLLA